MPPRYEAIPSFKCTHAVPVPALTTKAEPLSRSYKDLAPFPIASISFTFITGILLIVSGRSADLPPVTPIVSISSRLILKLSNILITS